MLKKKTDFVIRSIPYAINLECPYCKEEIEIKWEDVNAPKNWSDY